MICGHFENKTRLRASSFAPSSEVSASHRFIRAIDGSDLGMGVGAKGVESGSNPFLAARMLNLHSTSR